MNDVIPPGNGPSPAALWTAAFTKAQKAMPEIAKGKTAKIETKNGRSYSYSYADLPEIIKSVRPVLADNGLGFGQSVEATDRGVAVTTRIYHEGGHTELFGPIVLPAGSDAQSTGSAITYARRYSLCAALGIAADEDDDAQSVQKPKANPDADWGPSHAHSSPPAASTGAEPDQTAHSSSAPVAAQWDLIRIAVDQGKIRKPHIHARAAKLAPQFNVPVPQDYSDLKTAPAELLDALIEQYPEVFGDKVPA